MAELVIEALGAQGDGAATHEGAAVHVPFTLPGERIEAVISGDRAKLVKVLEPSPDRAEPVCRHFGDCGGCALQHMAPAAYLEWKRDQVVHAFAARGLSPQVALVIPATLGKRRRAVLTARRRGPDILLGYHRSHAHEVVEIAECPVLRPAIVAALPHLKLILKPLLTGNTEARITVLETASGLDISIDGVKEPGNHHTNAATAGLAAKAGFARLTIAGELLAQSRVPQLLFADAQVVPPPGAFIQAVEDAETELTRRVLAACAGAKHIADLFCGVGTFALPLARKAQVTAHELDPAAVGALKAAVAAASGLKKLTAERRDLFREPLSARELSRFDAVVFDPPRAGAKAQSEQLAASRVPVIVAVSCNPATLARDARTLVDGGYALGPVQPVDQFLYSPHVEAVAVFTRQRKH